MGSRTRDREHSTTWPLQVIDGNKSGGPDLKASVEWLYRSIIALLLGLLVYYFQKVDRKVDDFSQRIPAMETNQSNMMRILEQQAGDVRLLLQAYDEQNGQRRRKR